MNLTHLHLLLNHFPVIGTIIALGLYLIALVAKSDHLTRACLVLFLGLGLLTLPTYMSGNAAEDAICPAPADMPCPDHQISHSQIQAHEGAALYGFVFAQLTGAFAWLGLWQHRRSAHVPGWTLAAVLLLSLFTVGVMARASNLGGNIHHAEIQSGPAATAPPDEKPFAREVGLFVTRNTWMWPTCETLHFIGLCLLFGIATLVDLRVLGVIKGMSYPVLHRMLPWAILGFGVNLVTGMFFFVADPGQYVQNKAFHWKIILMLLAGLNVIYFTIFDEPWALKPGDDAPFTAKFVAASAMILVVGVMYCGRMLPFLGNSF
jgi:hypothetical protein